VFLTALSGGPAIVQSLLRGSDTGTA